MVGGPTRQPRRASASAARPDSAGEELEEVKAEFVSEGWARERKFRADSGNSGRVCFCCPLVSVLQRSIPSRLGAPRREMATARKPGRASPFRSVPFGPIGERPNRFVTPRRATVTSRRKQTNRSGGRCVPRAPPLLGFFYYFLAKPCAVEMEARLIREEKNFRFSLGVWRARKSAKCKIRNGMVGGRPQPCCRCRCDGWHVAVETEKRRRLLADQSCSPELKVHGTGRG